MEQALKTSKTPITCIRGKAQLLFSEQEGMVTGHCVFLLSKILQKADL